MRVEERRPRNKGVVRDSYTSKWKENFMLDYKSIMIS